MSFNIEDKKYLLIRERDGFVNATKLCKAGNKRFNNWYQNNSSRELIMTLSESLGIPSVKLIETYEGKRGGSWIHPKLSIHLAQWISSKFAVQISDWIDEWKYSSDENEQKYRKSLENIEPDDSEAGIERQIQIRLHEELGGEIEVLTDFGYIDLLTDRELIEIKKASSWKHGVGQLLAYGVFYQNHLLRLHLFDTEAIREDIIDFCKIHNIIITSEP